MDRVYIITHRLSGERILANGDELVRLIGVEVSYVDWVIEHDGVFENGLWFVR